ncbi:hypothetical protein [Lentilactobacillus kosonis]|uniref:Uncharacterized protein n=1 Tax=Lentilactobacillus kosonis TaxID=2810561 RepID=A0A401FIE3_9LACO|nr:hypothetical protein [Lentilactobacillus kosonis]GAY72031.1 hypothetical protein NBRC111893_177 [Lentilactobacillus kosonis]
MITFSKFGYNDATAELTVTKPETSNHGNSGNNNSGSGSVTNPTQPSTP